MVQKSYALSPTQEQESAKKQQENLFTPFYTSKAKGTGLGLAIVYRILESHKGKIRFSTRKMRELHLQYVYRLRQINTGRGR
jgi:signal transduction histidine kinase